MAELSLELAALAVAAVPDLDVAAALEHTYEAHGDFDASGWRDDHRSAPHLVGGRSGAAR